MITKATENINTFISETTETPAFEPDLPAAIILTILTTQGILGNILVITSVIMDKKLHTCIDAIVVNVSILDLLITGLMIPSILVCLYDPGRYYTGPLCTFLGFLATAACLSSQISLTFVACEKYVLICHNVLFVRLMTVAFVCGAGSVHVDLWICDCPSFVVLALATSNSHPLLLHASPMLPMTSFTSQCFSFLDLLFRLLYQYSATPKSSGCYTRARKELGRKVKRSIFKCIPCLQCPLYSQCAGSRIISHHS